MVNQHDLEISVLGAPSVSSPWLNRVTGTNPQQRLISNSDRIRMRVEECSTTSHQEGLSFEKAGPRGELFFDPLKCGAAIVTCGGLSPGLNNVIRSLVYELEGNYGVRRILGVPYGFSGFKDDAPAPRILKAAEIADIDRLGGSILGSSRGPVPAEQVLAWLVKNNVQLLFCVGGDGTMKGAHAIAEEAKKNGQLIAVVGVPKTIDNDVPYVWTTFGFNTAIDQATGVIRCAATEARSYKNCVSIVKLMGREAGFVAAWSSIAAQCVDLTLIPEIAVDLPAVFHRIEQCFKRQSSAVIVVAEGAGQELCCKAKLCATDQSGNAVLEDIGDFLRDQITQHFKKINQPAIVRYLDPSYSIRAVPANSTDSLLCDSFARAAVHAGMAGKTDLLIGLWYNNMTHVPLSLVIKEKKRIKPEQDLWRAVLAANC